MKRILAFLCVLAGGFSWAGALPDNMYFRAMQDEMKRTQTQLRQENSPAPYYVAYKLMHNYDVTASASFGELLMPAKLEDSLKGWVQIALGSPKNDNLGFQSDLKYIPTEFSYGSKSYEGIRQLLWDLSDSEFNFSTNVYDKKQSFKRQKGLPENGDDFHRAPQVSFIQEIPAYQAPDGALLEQTAKELSALGKELPFLKSFEVAISQKRNDSYYLNSFGGRYQYSQPYIRIVWEAGFQDKNLFEHTLSSSAEVKVLDDKTRQKLLKATREMLENYKRVYQSQQATAYLGPVLLKPQAAASLMQIYFAGNISWVTPLLTYDDNDWSAGDFRNKLGLRVISPLVDVYDRPFETEYKGTPLLGYTPVDDEGVRPQNLTFTENGLLKQFPLSSRSDKGNKKSNGHGRALDSYPRENTTNVFVEAKNPLTEAALEAKLLERCREMKLEYCYILPTSISSWDPLPYAERIYTKDGRKELVVGFASPGFTVRSLRDILAAGQDTLAVNYAEKSMVVPSLLVDEVELLPTDIKPDRKPVVAKPELPAK